MTFPKSLSFHGLFFILSLLVSPVFISTVEAVQDGSGNEVIPLNSATSLRVTDDTFTDNYFNVLQASGRVGIGTNLPDTMLEIDAGASAETVPLLTLDNAIGDFQVFVSDGDPLNVITANPGDLAVDVTSNPAVLYIKTSGAADSLNWDSVSSGGGASSLQDAYDGGETITTSDANDLIFTLSDTATDANFTVNLQGDTGDLIIQDSGTPFVVFNESRGVDMSAATVLTLPTAADPALTTVGQIAFDSTDNALIVHDGTAERVLAHALQQVTVSIYTDGDWDGEAVPFWTAPRDMGVTLVQINASVRGTSGSSITYNIEERAFGSLNSSGTDIFASDQVADDSGEQETSFSNADIAASAHLVFTTGTSVEVNGVTAFTATIYYRKNVE